MRFTPQQDFFLVLGRQKGPVDQLTPRELEVAKQLAQGASHKEIASNLAISLATARNHVTHIHAKLGSSKGTQVAAMLISEGML